MLKNGESKREMKKNKVKQYLVFCLNFICLALYSQPSIDWTSITWLNKDFPTDNIVNIQKESSDYDWWYDHCNAYANLASKTGHYGYVTCGVANFRLKEDLGSSTENPLFIPQQYDERNFTPKGCSFSTSPLDNGRNCNWDYENAKNPLSNHSGLGFNTVGLVNPNGSLNYIIPMNINGEYLRVKQLSDGNFLAVGNSSATRKRRSGLPLLYNPTPGHAGTRFDYTEIFSGALTSYDEGIVLNKKHWDMMKFDGTEGNCIFNFIYGHETFPRLPQENLNKTFDLNIGFIPTPVQVDRKQYSYLNAGILHDFVEDKSPVKNIAACGYITNGTHNVFKASAIRINRFGKKLSSLILDNTTDEYRSEATAIEYAVIDGSPYYLIAVSKQKIDFNEVKVEIYKVPGNFNYNTTPELVHVFNHNNPSNSSENKSIVYSMLFKNNKLYISMIDNSNHVFWARPGISAVLVYKVLDVYNGFNEITSMDLTNVSAYDLKSRITELNNGNFAMVSSVKRREWQDEYNCSVPSFDFYESGNYVQCPTNYPMSHWNSDAYVVEIDQNGNKIWEKDISNINNFDCSSPPLSSINKGADYSAHECLYGISEAPDGGIVLSGNCSGNYDDNYMIKLNPINQTNTRTSSDDFSFNIFPNPSTGLINIHFNCALSGSIEILDLFGRVLGSQILFSQSKKQAVDLGDIDPGVYIIKIMDDLGAGHQRKFVIAKP
ncbi:MAG: T9SS type A sorting domain-containing protein [Saprospiraceae bacterium]|nr:T9SS type A sorting domain-containing protein [Saprospiraceae bacterium]